MSKFFFLLITIILSAQEHLVPSEQELKNSINNNLIFELDHPDSLLIYRGFVVKYDTQNRIPTFTIHRLTPEQIDINNGQKARRRSNFFVDERIAGNSSLNLDYKKSGFDRGHMVPAGDFYWDQLLKNETFVLSNISPQTPVLNRGQWAYLEERIRNIVIELKDTAFVITGCVLSESCKRIGINNIGVPDFLYKIIYMKNINTMFAFLFNQNNLLVDNKLFVYQVSVDSIEIKTNLDFFEVLPDSLENRLESTIFNFDSKYEY